MDLAEICRVMRRRWYVLLPGLLLTAALTAGVYLMVPVTYQSQSTVALLNSQKATVAFDGNPFLSTQTSLTGMADSLARNLNSDASIVDLRAQGLTGVYQAKIADNAQGPLMWLTVTGTDPASVLESDKILTTYAEARLKQFQTEQSVAPNAMIRMTTVVPPQNPVAETKKRLQYLIMAGLLGFVSSMVAAFYVEARRRPRPASQPVVASVLAVEDGTDEQPAAPPVAGPVPPAAVQPAAPQPAAVQKTAAGEPAGQPAAPSTATPTVRPAPRWSKPVEESDSEATETEAHRFV
ncbi:chain length determinant protein [Streptomyces sp. RKAG337]|uniref:chain length determinant protein n=1 Tax=Streptomyces sp. RKAG337 TaxID=2893404 RepID=UPI002033AA02|nr:chain length determinant protein [Streptomyces sp. RKAG337]MCM2424737.1 chain length determinant protein [Streptomyces sp. RKAG337]